MDKVRKIKTVELASDFCVKTPIKAIRAKCLDCCCGSYEEVKLCPCQKCPLFPYRLGHRPKIKEAD